MATSFRQRLYRVSSPELHSFDGRSRVLKVDGFGQVSASQLWIAVEEEIVIAGNDDLVPEGKGAQPGVEIVDRFNRTPIEIAGVNQDVARRKRQPTMEAVRIANTDQAQRVL